MTSRTMRYIFAVLGLSLSPLSSTSAFVVPSRRQQQHRRASVTSRAARLGTPLLSYGRLQHDDSRLRRRRHGQESMSLFSSHTTSQAKEDDATADITILDQALSDCNLTAAIRFLQDNPTTSLSRDQWNAIFNAIEERTASAEENDPEWLRRRQQQQQTTTTASSATSGSSSAASFPLQSAARQEMTDLYWTLKRDMGQLTLFGAANTSHLDLLPASGSHALPPALLEEILALPMSALTPQPTNTLLLAGGVVAVLEILVATLFPQYVSLNGLVVLTVALLTMDRIFVNGAVLESFLKILSPGIQTKILRHEAGHFLTAYLLGCPVEGIVTSAWAALADKRFGTRHVSAGTSFFDAALSNEINSVPSTVTRASIDRYSIIVMAGIAAEAIAYQRADGGAGDEMALIAFLSQLGGGAQQQLRGMRGATLSAKSSRLWNSDKIRNQARWGALQAVLLLREYKPAYDALVDALERGGSLGDCIYAIEKAARDNDLTPISRPLGWIVQDKDGSPSWTTAPPSTAEAAMVASQVSGSETEPTASLNSAAATPREFDQEDSVKTLQEYRSQVEEKLRAIEDQLKKLEG